MRTTHSYTCHTTTVQAARVVTVVSEDTHALS